MARSRLHDITGELVEAVEQLDFSPPVAYVYNPLVYASASHRKYIDTYGHGTKDVLLVGMNPGPFGMAQTGVPFGDVTMVRDWMGIEEEVGKPEHEHPKRPVKGFECERNEVSGTRLWGWARDRFGAPNNFFDRFFVVNFCPLCFMEESGRNRTPDKLPANERQPLIEACNKALAGYVDVTQPQYVLGVGQFAEKQIRAAIDGDGITIGRILHPSPASPIANQGWAEQAEKELRGYGLTF